MFQLAATREGRKPPSEGPTRNKHPMWALNRVKMKINVPSRQDQNKKGINISTNATAGNQSPI